MNKKGKVGPFFYITEKIYADSVTWDEAEDYGDFKTFGAHFEFWDKLCSTNIDFADSDYVFFPRGRVVYNRVTNMFHIYLNRTLNKESVKKKVIKAFELQGLRYTIDDTDEHYQSL